MVSVVKKEIDVLKEKNKFDWMKKKKYLCGEG
jgi:hypothetical protein